MKNQWLSLSLLTLVSGCATAPKPNAVPTPTYFEKAAAMPLETVRGACGEVPEATTDAHALLPLANACVKAAQWTRVEHFGQALATRAPNAPWGAYYLSLAASARGDLARARWMIESALKKSPDQALFHFELARIFWATHDDGGVIKEMGRAAALDPNLAEAHVFNGQLRLRQNDFAAAKREFNLALTSQPHHPTARLGLAQTLLDLKEYVGAEDALTRAISANPRAFEARLALAKLQETQLKKYEDALNTLKDLRQLSAERKIDGTAPVDLNQRIQTLEKTVTQARLATEKSTRMPSNERK